MPPCAAKTQGHTLMLPDEAREVGHHQHPAPENRDTQHMVYQPRGSFPEILSLLYPTSRDPLSEKLALSQNGAVPPPLVLSFTQTHLCDTPFCYVLRDNCAICNRKQAIKSSAILSLQVLHDMRYRCWASKALPEHIMNC